MPRSITEGIGRGYQVQYGDMADDCISGTNINTGGITAAELATNSVTNTKLATSIRSPVTGVALGYKVARGTSTGTATKVVASGLSTIVACGVDPYTLTAANLNYAPVLSVQWATTNITVSRWKPTSATNNTMVAATSGGSFTWWAIGT